MASLLGKGRNYVHVCCCVTAQARLVLGIRGSFRLLTPFPQKFMLTHAQSIPSALTTTVKVISLQFRSLWRTSTLPHTALPSISSPPSSHTQSSAAPAFQTPSTARPCWKQLKLCQNSNMLAEALHTMCLPEANDLFVYVEGSHYQQLSRKKKTKNKWKQNKTEQEMKSNLSLPFLWNLKWEQEGNYFTKWSKT